MSEQYDRGRPPMRDRLYVQPRESRDVSREHSVTTTYRYGVELRTVVGPSRAACLESARSLYGEPDDVESVSTAESILADITGVTRSRHGQRGMHTDGSF